MRRELRIRIECFDPLTGRYIKIPPHDSKDKWYRFDAVSDSWQNLYTELDIKAKWAIGSVVEAILTKMPLLPKRIVDIIFK